MSDQNAEQIWITPAMGACLRQARANKGMTQAQLAELINASQPQIAAYERGEHDMALSRLFDLARLLDIAVADIFDA